MTYKVWYGEATSRLNVQVFREENYTSEAEQIEAVKNLIQRCKAEKVGYTVFRGEELVNM